MKKLLLIPGVLCNTTLWDDLSKILKDKYKIYYADTPQQATVRGMAKEMLDHAPEKFWAVGFSLGGWLALEAVRLKPEAIEGLILINTSDGTLLPSTRIAMQKAIDKMATGNFKPYITESLSLYLTKEHSHNSTLCQKINNMMVSVGPETACRQYQAMLDMKEPFDFLDKVNCPTLIIRGHDDKRHTLAMDQEFCYKIPNAKLVIIKNAAHFVTLEQPEALAEQIEIWRLS